MAKKEYLIHKRSSVSGQLPSGLQYGEIAVNFANGNEFLSIRNSNNSMVMFPASGIITTAINTAINALDVTDTAVAGKYVSAVAETDGKVSPSRANVSDAVLLGYTTYTGTSYNTITSDDSVRIAIAKLEKAINEYKLTVAAALNDLQNRVTSLESRVSALEP